MKTAGMDRSLVVRMLLLSILFSLFACGLHHGQMSAADLLGAHAQGAAQHSPHPQQAQPEHHAGHDQGLHHAGHFPERAAEQMPHPAGHGDHQLTPAFSCPLCSSFGAVLAINSRAWMLPPLAREALCVSAPRVEPEGPLRAPWSNLNPRAPPVLSALS